MLISRNWLQTHFVEELPNAEVLGDALTFHAFEIDGIEVQGKDAILDVKVTPNRGHDCLCHIGIAEELSAILKLELSPSSLGEAVIPSGVVHLATEGITASPSLTVKIETPLCSRYIATHIRGVKVGPSPDWLRERLESIGQRSINNIVDATNYVMFDLGQPLHAFDAGKLAQKDGKYAIAVRAAKAGEKMLALDEKEYTLNTSMLVIADANKDEAIGIAGVKGGMPAGITEKTTDIVLESANFDGVTTRKTAQALKLRTDASSRFEQVISPELAEFGMDAVIKLILDIAGGEVASIVDVYPNKQENKKVTISVEKINRVLGITLTGAEVADVFSRLRFAYKEENGVFEVVAPPERLDIVIAEDLIEEVGRIIGYDRVPPIELSAFSKQPDILQSFYWGEQLREALMQEGFSEIVTSVFSDKGERVVLNKVDGVRPYLRTSLVPGMRQALDKNLQYMDMLGLKDVRLFEIGTVFSREGERLMLAIGIAGVKKAPELTLHLGHAVAVPVPLQAPDYVVEIDLSKMTGEFGELPAVGQGTGTTYPDFAPSQTERYQIFSRYPYIVRDVAFWSDGNMDATEIEKMIRDEAGELCTKISLFDRFEKEGKVSLAYRLIFQSFDRTLTDEEVNVQMEKVYAKLKSQGFEIR